MQTHPLLSLSRGVIQKGANPDDMPTFAPCKPQSTR
nr:MAG TPA_asm: hypothetical protein [Caudoviricetes sp.]